MIDRDAVLAALRAEDVAAHLGIDTSRWRGRWLRSRRCARTDHPSEAFGLSRDGHWHCFACDEGGDLLALVAASAGEDVIADFPRVLAAAAAIAGVDDDDGAELFPAPKPAPRERPPVEPQMALDVRITRARKRATWLWERLWSHEVRDMPTSYLRSRRLDPEAVYARERVRSTPVQLTQELRAMIDARDPKVTEEVHAIWRGWGTRAGTEAIAIQVRSVVDGEPVDIRARRIQPLEGQPKVIGMVGGVTSAPAEQGRARQLLGCFGHPHRIDSDAVIVVEGMMDYLTAISLWPNAQVLGAVEAGSFSLVAGHAARALAERDDESRLLLIEQHDPPRVLRDGRTVAGAADAAVNEDPNAAMKVAIRHLGARGRVEHLLCAVPGRPGTKDLNDLVSLGVDVASMIRSAP